MKLQVSTLSGARIREVLDGKDPRRRPFSSEDVDKWAADTIANTFELLKTDGEFPAMAVFLCHGAGRNDGKFFCGVLKLASILRARGLGLSGLDDCIKTFFRDSRVFALVRIEPRDSIIVFSFETLSRGWIRSYGIDVGEIVSEELAVKDGWLFTRALN